MKLPVWLQNEGAWIAIGISLLFVIAGLVMHRVFLRVLRAPTAPSEKSSETDTHE